MSFTTKRGKPEIDDQIDAAINQGQHGSKWPGMSYEEGVRAALDWIVGDVEEAPMDQE